MPAPGKIVVQKYGGSSLAEDDQVWAVAERVAAAHRAGRQVAVIVSARGRTTDELLRLAGRFGATAPGREVDQLVATGETVSSALLAIAVRKLGVPATALSGAQCGVMVTGRPGAGVIVAVDTERIGRLLRSGQVVVIAGFQGATEYGDVITLGRGGSDTTAVAIAAELDARWCEIYTDVAGVYTADPRIEPAAHVVPRIPADVMMEMAFAGAKVMHCRAVELAAMYGVEIHVNHSFQPGTGTVIYSGGGEEMLEKKDAVMAVVYDRDVARVSMRLPRMDRAAATEAFRFLFKKFVPVDMTGLAESATGGFSATMTLRRNDLVTMRDMVRGMTTRWGGELAMDDAVAKISVVGTGLLSRPEYAGRVLDALTEAGIETSSVVTSQHRISVTVPDGDTDRAVSVLHDEFELAAEPVSA